ncbi:DUF2752 domain-containing protein [Mycolicibacterium sphagni]|nr:DUF2752 domain-containing protein [Mycolicibacterium sphagni]
MACAAHPAAFVPICPTKAPLGVDCPGCGAIRLKLTASLCV